MHKVVNDASCLFYLEQDDPAALEYLIKIYFPVLCNYVERIVVNRAEAEDVTEDVFIKVWERRRSIKTLHALKGFLYTTARNAALNVLRSRKREHVRNKEFSENHKEDLQEDTFVYEEMLAEIRRSIYHLPEKVREIFILSYYEKMSNAEIADRLHLSQQTVKNQKTRALLLLKKALQGKSFLFLLATMLVRH
jgi:RNA polymerase sigma-70 factor (ECF subfamily)